MVLECDKFDSTSLAVGDYCSLQASFSSRHRHKNSVSSVPVSTRHTRRLATVVRNANAGEGDINDLASQAAVVASAAGRRKCSR